MTVVVSPKDGKAKTKGTHLIKMGKIPDGAASSVDIGGKHANPCAE